MNNSTNDDLVFQVQLLENTYDRNKVTQTLRKGKSSKDDSFAYTGGKKPKTIFTKTTDKMINEYKEDYEKRNLNLNNLGSLQDPDIVPIDGLEFEQQRLQDAIGRLNKDLQDAMDAYEDQKQVLSVINKKLNAPDEINIMDMIHSSFYEPYEPVENRSKYTSYTDLVSQEATLNKIQRNRNIVEEKKTKIKAELQSDRDAVVDELKRLEDDISNIQADLRGAKGLYDRIVLLINTTKNENRREMNDYRNRAMAAQSTYIREQTPGEPEDEYKESIISKFKPPSDASIQEAAIYKQIKLLKANFSKIFDMSNPRRIAIVEDVIQMLQDKYDNGIYDTNTKWTKIATKLLEIYGYDNSNVTKESLEQIIAQYIIASPTAENLKEADDWYKDFEDKVNAAVPPNIDSLSDTSLTNILNSAPDKKQETQLQQPAEDTDDTKSVESFRSIKPYIENTPPPPPPLSDQTMDLAQEIKQLAAIDAKKEPEAKTTGRKYAQAKLIITEPKFYVLLIRHRGNIFIGVSQTGEIGTYTVKPYFAVLKNGMLLHKSEGQKLDKKKSVVRPYDQWSNTNALDPFQLGALGDKYYDIKTGDPKIKNPAREDVLDVEDGEQNIQFDYNDEIVRWMTLNPHYTLKGDADTLGRTDFIKTVSTPRIVGAGISIPKHDKIVHFGNVLLMYDRLLRHNMLSIKKKGGGNIEHFKNVKVSDKFVDIITGALNKQNIGDIYHELSEKEQELYNILVQVSNVHKYVNIPKPNIKFLKDRLKIVEGEIEAGNDNLIGELTDILHTMMVVKLITKKEAKEHLQYYMDMNQ